MSCPKNGEKDCKLLARQSCANGSRKSLKNTMLAKSESTQENGAESLLLALGEARALLETDSRASGLVGVPEVEGDRAVAIIVVKLSENVRLLDVLEHLEREEVLADGEDRIIILGLHAGDVLLQLGEGAGPILCGCLV